MLAFAKVAVLVLLAILAFALSSEGRELLDYYGDCWGGKALQMPLYVVPRLLVTSEFAARAWASPAMPMCPCVWNALSRTAEASNPVHEVLYEFWRAFARLKACCAGDTRVRNLKPYLAT